MTLLEGIQKSAEFLAGKGIDSPRLQAELLLAHLLKMPRMHLYLNFARMLSAAETDRLRELVRRRGQREPLQHIVGSTSFCGLELEVNPEVLIPRPETELLAEAGWDFLSSQGSLGANALDFGTGSGCIAIALAVKCPGVEVWALDASPEALKVARANAARHQVSERIRFEEGERLEALPGAIRFNLVICNPPYIPTAEIETLQPEVRDHDPRRALDGGADGLGFFRMLAACAAPWLKGGGRIMVELGDGQAGAVQGLFEGQKWVVEAVRQDYAGHPRILIAKPD